MPDDDELNRGESAMIDAIMSDTGVSHEAAVAGIKAGRFVNHDLVWYDTEAANPADRQPPRAS